MARAVGRFHPMGERLDEEADRKNKEKVASTKHPTAELRPQKHGLQY